jgi:tRNA A-37 threonylcarbamoyl transferase component Bud32
MDEFPFQLLIKRDSPNTQTESLLCTALLRAIPGRRQVYDALWNGKSVIVKVFSHKISAKRHLKKEWQGLNLLQSRGLNAPQPLFYGQTENGQQAVVMEKIIDSTTALDAIRKTPDETAKLNLLAQICEELARQHNKGVLQKDLHLGNFLVSPVRNSTGRIPDAAAEKGKISNGVSGDKVFVLDPGQMRFFSHQISKEKSISQLASLGNCLPTSNTESIARVYKQYFRTRGWHFEKSDEALLQKQLIAHRKRAVKKWVKKCLRTTKRYLKIKTNNFLAVFDKSFCEGDEPLDFIKQIDALMDKGQILKSGHTCFVSRSRWNDKDIVIKRYNHKGFIHSLQHTIKGSRARRAWLHAHRLMTLQIPTPKPLAYIEQRKGPLVWKSYLVTEYVDGQKLYNFLEDGSITQQQRSAVTRQVMDLLNNLGQYRISHGDLKHSNILITNNGPVLTDLDGMKRHKWHWMYRYRQKKDLTRFG